METEIPIDSLSEEEKVTLITIMDRVEACREVVVRKKREAEKIFGKLNKDLKLLGIRWEAANDELRTFAEELKDKYGNSRSFEDS